MQDYITQRLGETTKRGDLPSKATLNRELAALMRMLTLGAKSHPPKVLHVPFIPRLREDNVRQGFFSIEEYRAVLETLSQHIRPLLVAAFWTGMRLGELRALAWDTVERGFA